MICHFKKQPSTSVVWSLMFFYFWKVAWLDYFNFPLWSLLCYGTFALFLLKIHHGKQNWSYLPQNCIILWFYFNNTCGFFVWSGWRWKWEIGRNVSDCFCTPDLINVFHPRTQKNSQKSWKLRWTKKLWWQRSLVSFLPAAIADRS